MKRLFLIIIVPALLLCCKQEQEAKIEGYRVIGEAPGVHNGIRAYLKYPGPNGRQVVKDTAIVINEKFKFEGGLEQTEMVNLTINSVQGVLPVILENEEIKININKEKLTNSKIYGGESNSAMIEFKENFGAITEKNDELGKKYRQASAKDKQALSKQLLEIKKRRDNYPFKFLKEHPDNYYALMLTDYLVETRREDIEKISKYYNELSEDLKTTEFGKSVNRKIKAMADRMAALRATEIGKKAPNFSAPNPEGEIIALKDVLGKVTIVDFWAAWCGPCRRENPNVVKVYEQYKDKGLEIIGVSLDGNRRQKDPKAAWKKAIKDDNLTWHQVSNLKYFNDPIARSYNIRSIPATFVLDENGVIIATNLRGKALEAKISEILN